MKFDFDQFYDFGHYGIFAEEEALYPQVRELLQKALDSGEDFDTGWHGFKKEIQSIRIKATGNEITVEVCQSMDEMPDLIFDCDGADDLTDDEIDEVMRVWYGSDYTTDTYESALTERDGSIIEILTVATKLAENCSAFLNDGYEFVNGTVNEVRERRMA